MRTRRTRRGSRFPRIPRILVVEDQDDIRGMLMMALQIEGYRVDEACNALEGLQKLHDTRYDVVLTDYAMPGRTGIWMLDEARRLGLLDHTMTLIVTAHPEATELRGLDVVHKPLDLDRLMDQVNQLVTSSRG